MIRLIGPGGVGKRRTGPLPAARLGVRPVDERFGATVGGISKYGESHGHDEAVAANLASRGGA